MSLSKERYLNKIPYDVIWSNRRRIVEIYPETRDILSKPLQVGCSNCGKKRAARAILNKIYEIPAGRNVRRLKGVFPNGLLELL